jgi:large subunit ribosomal protein L19
VRAFEQKQIESLQEKIQHPKFRAGDTLRVIVDIEEGGKKWTQTSEGVCINKVNKGISSNFVIRRLDLSIAIEMRFSMFAQGIRIEVIKRGAVRRAKLYYLRHCSRKAGRIKELAPGKKR